jgi:hypothetical protein
MQNMRVKSLMKSGGEKTKSVSFRLTLTEYNLLASNARKHNMKMSDYARKVLVDNLDIREGRFTRGDILTASVTEEHISIGSPSTSSTDSHYVVVGGENLTTEEIEKRLGEMWK